MAGEIRQTFVAAASLTATPLNNLANDADATVTVGSILIAGTEGPFADTLEITLTGIAGSVNYVEVWYAPSIDNSKFADANNDIHIGNVKMNGAAAVDAHINFSHWGQAYNLRFANRSGAALSGSGHTVRRQAIPAKTETT